MVVADAQLAETVTVKACNACRGGLLERDKFCRWCGSPQTHSLSPLAGCQDRTPSLSLSPYTTSALNRDSLNRDSLNRDYHNQAAPNQAALVSRPYSSVSGPLVRALIAGVSGGRSDEPGGRVVRSMVQALVSIPIWLMIVLLSPIDAYVAAKSISRQF